MAKNRGLGKGLGALFGETDEIYNNEMSTVTAPVATPVAPIAEAKTESFARTVSKAEPKVKEKVVIKEVIKEVGAGEPLQIYINLIEPNPDQPRKNFDEEALNELASSISQHGVIQPIVVTKKGEKFVIIAGERRWRASRLAGLEKIPAIVKDYTDQQIKEISLIENLQREDLNPIEAARAIKTLMDEYNFTQEEVSRRIGKARPTITNMLRLLSLGDYVVNLIERGRLSAGHARCLITLESSEVQSELALKACDNKMSVRDLENAVKRINEPKIEISKRHIPQSLELTSLVENMQRVFATRVTAIGNNRKGRISIDYFSTDDLERILELIESLQNRRAL